MNHADRASATTGYKGAKLCVFCLGISATSMYRSSKIIIFLTVHITLQVSKLLGLKNSNQLSNSTATRVYDILQDACSPQGTIQNQMKTK